MDVIDAGSDLVGIVKPGELIEQFSPPGERCLGAGATFGAEEVAFGQASEPALQLLPVGLALLELREPEALLACLPADLVLEALDAVEDLVVLGVAGAGASSEDWPLEAALLALIGTPLVAITVVLLRHRGGSGHGAGQ